jgi:ketosteroid isomerase-like protein
MEKTLMKRQCLMIAAVVTLGFSAVGNTVPIEDRHEEHEALRQLLTTVTTALNTRNLDALDNAFTRPASITSVDQQVFTDVSGFKDYYRQLFEGPKARIKTASFVPDADERTTFLSPTVGICRGSSRDTYHFTDGDERTMDTRWTATLVKESGGWKVAALHLGVNFLNNPVLTAAKRAVYIAAGVGLFAGIIVCCVIGWVRRR